ncbi:MAG TPA: universal stress protein, partial [Puia sp.]|nr:universal stress protein [Puia sp.]
EEMLDDARKDLENLAEDLGVRAKGKLTIETRVEIGTVVNQIKEFSNQENPFAVVFGTHGKTALERFLLGSNSLSAIKHLHVPVLIIPDQYRFVPITRIGLASDLAFSQAFSRKVPYWRITEWLSSFNASLDIVHVSKSEHPKYEDLSESISVEHQLYKFHPAVHFLTGSNLQEKLAEFAKERQLDLLIIVPQHHGIEDLFVERHAKKIILNQRIPVLSLHA